MNNGQPYTLTSTVRAVIRGTKPDGKEIFNVCELIDNNTVRVEITQQIAAVPGKGNYEISIMSTTENRVLTSFPFFIVISPSSIDASYITSSDEFHLLISKINQVDKMEGELDVNINKVNEAVNKVNTAVSDVNNAIITVNEATVKCTTATNNCINATNTITQLGQDFQNAEIIRVRNENERIESENDRKTNENDRKTSESIRKDNENTRIENENIRIEKEDARILNEMARISSENIRIKNENIRIENEKIRIENEKIRQSMLKKTINTIFIPSDMWYENKVYIKCDEITPDSIITIYYNSSSLDTVIECGLRYTHFNGYVCIEAKTTPIYPILIDHLIIENNILPIDGFLVKNLIKYADINKIYSDLTRFTYYELEGSAYKEITKNSVRYEDIVMVYSDLTESTYSEPI